jgi:hypothetical protein
MTFTLNVKGKINIKRRIIVNGREYSSHEENPEDIRRAYERAMANVSREGDAINSAASRTKISFNDKEYGNVDEMPEDLRRLYDAAMMTVEAHGSIGAGTTRTQEPRPAPLAPDGSASASPSSMAPIDVGGDTASSFSRMVTLGIVVLMLVGALYYLSRVLLAR